MSNVSGRASLVRASAALALAAAALVLADVNSIADLRRYEAVAGKPDPRLIDRSVPFPGCDEGMTSKVGDGCGSMTGGRSGGPDQS